MPSPISNPAGQYPTSFTPASGVTHIDALIDDFKWGGALGTGANLTYSFPYLTSTTAYWDTQDSGKYSSLNEPEGSSGLNAVQRQAVQGALAAWSNVANITFSQVADGQTNVGDLRFTWTSAAQENSVGWAFAPSSYWASGGDVWLSQPAIGNKPDSYWSPGNFGFKLLLHEIGHALAFKHPFEGTPQLSGAQDSLQYSVMSYTEHPHAIFRKVTPNSSGDYDFLAYYVEPDTPMLYDIAAIQYLYGANTSYRSGDDTYSFDPATPFFRTLWDAGGNDTLSAANFSKGVVIDLNAGAYSSITIESDPLPAGYSGGTVPTYYGTDNLAIAYGSLIENTTGGSGADRITGNSADNLLQGKGGNDTLNGSAGDDTALYAARRTDYTVTRTSSGHAVADKSGAEGTDQLSAIEHLRFSDKSVNLTIQAKTVSLGTAKLNTLVELYIAYFNRVPDADGLSYWIDQYVQGQTLEQIGQSFYSAAVQYSSLTGYSATMDNGDFVRIVYANVLGRSGGNAPPQADVDYWAGNLASGNDTRGSLIQTMLTSAHTFKGDATWGWVADLLDNKTQVGKVFAVEQGLGYLTSAENISQGMNIAAAVTATSTTAALGLIGINDPPLTA
ncbi:DUF4214 domain-containing protein [Denitratisoma oestradiolicum]|uniref:Peptidase M10 serralysin C terminal n=1 Tax=Denitratisoma oestradiolicum TaxID=311182 RepID=A0A6S6XRI6_9PROT|nr:DUF4214 domain-containing protein [Denitratisoma oestradiolicum]TWO80947.1 hypothetical protein CBW56_07290 [Denitratisoma oestradiolicum]CAB1367280.1 Peptidase M10 serralysin C terminal [Denitratisoma oestradiolicum]